jgi:hypothetical protein
MKALIWQAFIFEQMQSGECDGAGAKAAEFPDHPDNPPVTACR